VRFGIANSAHCLQLITTDASCGGVNAMHDSFTPPRMVPMVNIMLDETVFGGDGRWAYGILIYVVLAVFIAAEGGPDAGILARDKKPSISRWRCLRPWCSLLQFSSHSDFVLKGFRDIRDLQPRAHGFFRNPVCVRSPREQRVGHLLA